MGKRERDERKGGMTTVQNTHSSYYSCLVAYRDSQQPVVGRGWVQGWRAGWGGVAYWTRRPRLAALSAMQL